MTGSEGETGKCYSYYTCRGSPPLRFGEQGDEKKESLGFFTLTVVVVRSGFPSVYGETVSKETHHYPLGWEKANVEGVESGIEGRVEPLPSSSLTPWPSVTRTRGVTKRVESESF